MSRWVLLSDIRITYVIMGNFLHPSPTLSDSENLSPNPPAVIMGKGCRQKCTSVKLQDYVINTVHVDSDSDFIDDSWYPIESYVDSSQFSAGHRAFLAVITAGVIPQTYAEAFADENWCGAVCSEIDALEESGTWTVETLPPGKTAPGCKSVFTLKYRSMVLLSVTKRVLWFLEIIKPRVLTMMKHLHQFAKW